MVNILPLRGREAGSSYSDILRRIGLNKSGSAFSILKEHIKLHAIDDTILEENRRMTRNRKLTPDEIFIEGVSVAQCTLKKILS